MTQKHVNKNVPKWVESFDVIYDYDGEQEKSLDKQEEEQKASKVELAKMLETVNEINFTEGEVLQGNVVAITDDFITVDIGYKQEGLVPSKEFRSFDGSMKIKAGDTIDVYLEKLESALGNLVLSKDKAEILKAWDKISSACENGEPVEGTVIQKVKGGLSVDIGVKAFLPGSQIDLRPSRNLDKYIGKAMKFKVIKFNKKRGNIVLSRRAILQEERGKLRNETLGAIQEGMIVKGIVKNITDYGAFIDLGGVDGLLHITDMSWGRVKHPGNLLSVGDEIEVKILKFDQDKERVSLGLKQVQPNPWETASDTFVSGLKVTGRIVSVKDYGVFVELDGGIEGLIHISEMSWTQKIRHPSKMVSPGEDIEAIVLEVDTENKRISLGLKQLLPNPWDSLVKNYEVGQKVKGKIKSIVDFGMFVNLGEEIDALIHVSDVSWTRKNINLANEYNVGDEIEARVLTIDKENQKFCLGIKQLEEDPWKRIEERFPIGTIVSTDAVRVTEFGIFVELETGIEGLIHISEISEERVEKPSDIVKRGDKVQAMVISVDKEAKKIALSMKVVEKNEQDSAMQGHKQEEIMKTVTLGDKFKGLEIKKDDEN